MTIMDEEIIDFAGLDKENDSLILAITDHLP